MLHHPLNLLFFYQSRVLIDLESLCSEKIISLEICKWRTDLPFSSIPHSNSKQEKGISFALVFLISALWWKHQSLCPMQNKGKKGIRCMITYQLFFMIYIIKYHLAVCKKFYHSNKSWMPEAAKLSPTQQCNQAFPQTLWNTRWFENGSIFTDSLTHQQIMSQLNTSSGEQIVKYSEIL